jgi:hypothetical protein
VDARTRTQGTIAVLSVTERSMIGW